MTDYQGNILIKNPATPTGPFETGSAPGIWRLQEAMAFKRLGIWPTQGVQGADPYYKFVSLLLSTTSLGNANNNLFVDSSGAFLPISRNGNTTQGSMTPYGANWSNYFDGSGDYLTVASNAAFNLSSGDFTIEFYVYKTVDKTCTWISGNEHDWRIEGNSNGRMYYVAQGTGLINPATVLALNTWHHIALVKNGATTTLYINGVASGTTTTSPTNANSVVYIGINPVNSGWAFQGYLSNIRVVKGTAVYTSNFTPPTQPLTAITNTSLLTCQSNRFRDASSNNFTITVNGETRVTDFAPFSPGSPGIVYNQSDITNWSGYFDGNGDWLTIPNNAAFSYGTGDFTMEVWVYKTATSGDRAVVDSYTLGSGGGTFGFLINDTQIVGYQTNVASYTFTYTVPNNSWNHIAFVRTGGNLICYVNGTSIGSQANSTNFVSASTIDIGRNAGSGGSQWIGYLSNLRIVKGTAVYTGNFTPPTTNLTAISGTSLLTLQNAAFTDNSTNNFVITPNGNVTVTGNSPFNPVGYWSNYFDGSSTITFNTISLAGDFTIEAWVYFIGTNNPTVVGGNPPNNQTLRRVNGKHYFYRQGVDITGTADVPLNQWVHLAATRSNGEVRIFTNGVLDGNRTINGTYTVFCLGGVNTADDRLTGYTSNVRIVDGTALYTATFTPPTAPLTAVSGTVLLTSQNGTFKDNSTNNLTLTRNGSPTIQSFDPFYTATIASNGGSMYFDGSGDYLSIGSNAALPAGNARYTIEAWIYPTALNTNNGIVGWGSWGTNNAVNAVKITSTTLNNYWWNNDINASFAFKTNSWYHIVCQFDGTTRSAYVNGVRLATDTPTGHNVPLPVANCTVGTTNNASENFTGYISGLKVTSGAALYSGASYTVPTTPATPAASTSLLVNGMNAGIYDATTINDMETVGNAQVSTAVSKFGGSSIALDGTGDYLKAPNSDVFAFRTGDFTVEMWAYFADNAATNRPLFDTGVSSNTGRLLIRQGNDAGTSNVVNAFVSGTTVGSPTISFNQWTHVAVVRQSGTVKIYINGTGGTGVSASADLTQNGCLVGAFYDQLAWNFTGYIDDLRVTKGVARYTSNFTPPDKAFPTY